MFQIALQAVVAIALLILAMRIQLSIHRRRNRNWESILGGVRNGHERLVEMSHLVEATGYIHCSEAEIESFVQSSKGLYRMYMNMEVLLEAMNFVAGIARHDPNAAERIPRVRRDAAGTQMQVALLFARGLWAPIRKPPSAVAPAAIKKYLAVIADFGLLLSHDCPDLYREYRYFVAR